MDEIEKLKDYAARVVARGPSRVMISEDEGVCCARARGEYGITPDIIFIRDDGWTLGAPSNLIAAAERTWADDWIGVLVKPESKPVSYHEWRKTLDHHLNHQGVERHGKGG